MNIAYKFSVIIPTYNRAERLKIALESLSKQTFRNFEVLVCDDGSTDNTKEIVEFYKERLDLTYIWQENWGGPARPRNIGIKASRGEWICFLDSDDWWFPEKLEKCLPYIDQYDLIYHDLVVSRNDVITKELIKGRDIDNKNAFLDLLIKRNGIANSSVVIKKRLIEKAGYLSEDKALIATEDYDLWLRIAQFTNQFYHIPYCLGVYYIGSDNITSHYLKRNERELYIYKKYESYIPYDSKTQAIARLNFYLSVNYAMANDFRYLKSLFQVLINGSLKMKLWATFNLFFGLIFIKIFHKPVY